MSVGQRHLASLSHGEGQYGVIRKKLRRSDSQSSRGGVGAGHGALGNWWAGRLGGPKALFLNQVMSETDRVGDGMVPVILDTPGVYTTQNSWDL